MLRTLVRNGRERGAAWVRLLDGLRALATPAGRGRQLTALIHRDHLHQITSTTWLDRYPRLFGLAAELRPEPRRILSFGCSTGEELLSLRSRFPLAQIVGAEINRHSRRIAGQRIRRDPATTVLAPEGIEGKFDLIFAMAVLQWRPHWVEERAIADLSPHYPFARFDRAAVALARMLAPDGLLIVEHVHYRLEDSRAARLLEPVEECPAVDNILFAPDGRRYPDGVQACTVFRRRSSLE